MERRGKEGLAAVLAVVVAALLVAPTPLGAGVRPPEPPSCLTVACDPSVERLVDLVGDQLALRMGQLDDPARREIAKTVVAEASSAGVDPLLVLAVIAVESAFDPEAQSHRGAMGLMQLLEPTMRQELTRGGIAFDDPHDPVANVQAGVRYLRRLLDAFGREDLALMAYNAGPNRILGFLRAGGVPERFRAYPRRVRAELRRLHGAAAESGEPLVAESRIPSQGQ